MAGSTTRLPLPSSTFGRRWCLLTFWPRASAVLHGAPTSPEFKVAPELFRTLLLERLRLPVEITDARCECGIALDTQAHHRATCARSGRLRSRALGPERTLARVCREAGATVHVNAKLGDMNVAVRADDMRSIEVLASGLPLHHGAQLAVDITLRCALTAASQACPCRYCKWCSLHQSSGR